MVTPPTIYHGFGNTESQADHQKPRKKTMTDNLTPKQETFARHVAEGDTYAAA